MRIAIDARMIEHSGVGSVIRGWLEGLACLPADERPRIVLLGDPSKLDAYATPINASVVSFRASIYSLAEQIHYPSSDGRWDLLFVPHYAHPLFYDEPFVGTVHDRFHIQYGSTGRRFYQRMMLSRLKSRRCLIVTGSHHVRNQLVEVEKFNPERIVVVHHGIEERFISGMDAASEEETRRELRLPSSYLLWVGICKPHKNIDRLIAAVNLLKDKTPMPLVMAGFSEQDAATVRAKVNARQLQKWIVVLGKFHEVMKHALFFAAHGLIFPSLDEGFGLPPLEAMALGVPCAVSDCPPMNELLEGAALFFDPLSEQAIADAILQLANDEALRDRLRHAGLLCAAQFTCRRSAAELVKVWEQALQCEREAVRL